MVKVSIINKRVYLSPVHFTFVSASATAETKKEATKLAKAKIEEKERKMQREYLENQKKCQHARITRIQHLDGSTGLYCKDCGKRLKTEGGLFSDDFLQVNAGRFGKRYKCKTCGFEFTWGGIDIDYCEHLDNKQPLTWLLLGLVEEVE